MTTSYIRDKNGALVDAATVTLPANRNFRNSWVTNGAVLEVDMAEARLIFKAHVGRAAREQLKDAIVPDWLDSFIESNATKRAAAEALRTACKNAQTSGAIDSATTPDELKALWNESILGLSPFV